ncbi:MAG: DUF499 domain-containing protein [Solirubrobacterales bacterium]|nr:DUF499 domain-containing protein [Solirubrobacterales bacterium]
MAKGARPSNIAEFIDPELIPDGCQIAAVVGDTLDPSAGLTTRGHHTYTIWGEIAAQLGPAAFKAIQNNETDRTAPGDDVWKQVIEDKPTIIVIDELAAYMRTLSSSGSADIRRMAEAMPAFLKRLYEAAAGNPNLVVVITFASTRNAFGKETTDLEQAMKEAEGSIRADEVQSVTERGGSILKPAEDDEIGEILKRRLFKEIDQDAARSAGDAYRDLYQELKDRNETLSGGADRPVTYGEQVARTYPFHPELIRVLDKRLGAIPNFQRARGSLRLLAETVANIYSGSGENPEIINLADIDLSNTEIRNSLTTGIDRSEFDGVAVADFAGPDSHAAQVDSTRFAGRRPYAVRAARTVFIHSLEISGQTGAGIGDWTLGTLATGDDPTVIGEALSELSRTAWYLAEEPGERWRFVTEEQPAKIIASEAKNVPNTAVREALEARIAKIFADDGAVKVVLFPSGSGDLPEKAALRLAVIHQDDLTVTSTDASPPPSKLVGYLEKAGASESIRTNRNSLCFLVADSDATESMKSRIKNTLALERIVEDSAKMASFAEPVSKKLQNLADQAQMETRIAITRCYKHLYYPFSDRANKNLRHVELSPSSQGEQSGSHTAQVIAALETADKVRTTPLSTDQLKSKAWPKGQDSVTTKEVAGWFWSDHSAPILLDPTLLREAIRKGVANDQWVVYEAQTERAFTKDGPAPPVEISDDILLYEPAAAEDLGLSGRAPRVEDVTAILENTPAIDGDTLRAKLEEATNREPSKGQVTEILARGAEGGEDAKFAIVFKTPAPGDKAAIPSDIRKGPLSSMTVLSMEEARRLSLDLPGQTKIRPATGSGAAGVAFQTVLDEVNDSPAESVQTLEVKAKADPGEGTRDVKLLGMAIAQLPKHDISASISVEMDFIGLKPGAEIHLSGPARDYQKIEDELIALGTKASDFQGTFSLVFDFGEGVEADAAEFEAVRKTIVGLDPGEVTVTARLV